MFLFFDPSLIQTKILGGQFNENKTSELHDSVILN